MDKADPAHTPGIRECEYQRLDEESWHYLGQSWPRTWTRSTPDAPPDALS